MKKVTTKIIPRPVAYRWIAKLQTHNLLYRQCIGEFLGTFILILLIDSALSVGLLTGNHQTVLYVSFAAGVGLYLGYIIAGTSGVGHLNPAVTISLISVRKADWKKAPLFIIAQILGAFLASLTAYFQYYPYFQNINDQPAKYTVHVLHSMPGPSTTIVSTLIDQIACVGLLMIAFLALTDKCNTLNSKHQAPIGFIFVLAALIMAFGLQCTSINPAREIAGRLLSVIIGLGDKSFSPLDYNFWIISTISPIIGGLLGSWIYYLLVEIHSIDEDLQKEENDVSTQTPNQTDKESSTA